MSSRLITDAAWPSRYELLAMIERTTVSAIALALCAFRPFTSSIAASVIWRPVAALGTISYSLYLVHQLNFALVATVARYRLPAKSPQPTVVMTQVVLDVALATVYCYFCERPFLRGVARPADRVELAVTTRI